MFHRLVLMVRAGVGVSALAVAGCGGNAAPSNAALPTSSAGLPSGSGLVIFRRPGYSVGVLPGKRVRIASSFQGSGTVVRFVFFLSRQGDAVTEVGSVAATFDDAAIVSTIDSAARSAGGTVAAETKTTYEGLPARDARIGNAGGKATLFIRVIGGGKAGYFLGYIIKGDVTAPPAQYRALLASLTIG